MPGLLAADHENQTSGILGSLHRHRFATGGQVEQLKLKSGQVGWLCSLGCVGVGQPPFHVAKPGKRAVRPAWARWPRDGLCAALGMDRADGARWARQGDGLGCRLKRLARLNALKTTPCGVVFVFTAPENESGREGKRWQMVRTVVKIR